jgi:hypothetical protein
MKNGEHFRKLESYKITQHNVAEKKGCLKELQEAATLTEARKILYGVKRKNVGKKKIK